MKFIVDRASDDYKAVPTEVEMNTLEELIKFIKENWEIILKEEEVTVEKYRWWEKLSCNKYYDREKTWRMALTIYDDYVE